jgi:hypothetical protein
MTVYPLVRYEVEHGRVGVAAAPLIAEQVRAQVAAEIEALRDGHVSSYGPVFDDGFTSACDIAADIARGESS